MKSTLTNENMTIGLSATVGVNCSHCNGLFFQQSFIIRKLPRFLIGAPQDEPMFVPVFRCQDCGEVLREFFPEGMKDVEQRLGMTKVENEPTPQTPPSKLII